MRDAEKEFDRLFDALLKQKLPMAPDPEPLSHPQMIEGSLHKTMTGRWAICRSGQSPVEITSGEVFCVEVDGKMRVTRMEHDGREYYAVNGFPLRDGMGARLGVERST